MCVCDMCCVVVLLLHTRTNDHQCAPTTDEVHKTQLYDQTKKDSPCDKMSAIEIFVVGFILFTFKVTSLTFLNRQPYDDFRVVFDVLF